MEEQVNGIHPHLRRWMILLPIIMAMLACRVLMSPRDPARSVSPGPTGETIQTISAPQGSANETTQNTPDGPDPLDRLLEMPSIQFSLTALQPDGSSRSVQGEIDNAGNMHLKFHTPVLLPSDLPEKFNRDLKLPEETELYVVDGKAYQPDDENPAWMTKPLDDNYGKELSALLHGPDGPGLWLDLLPAGSLKSAGKETVGGFVADKYAVSGSVNNQTIVGSLWYESHTLVRAELNIPAALLDPGKPAIQGGLKIKLEVQKTDVPPVMLPAPPAETPGTGS